MIDEHEVKLRCIEAAARNPTPNSGGYTAGTLEAAKAWAGWVLEKKLPQVPDGKADLF